MVGHTHSTLVIVFLHSDDPGATSAVALFDLGENVHFGSGVAITVHKVIAIIGLLYMYRYTSICVRMCACIGVRTYVCMYVCVYVCMCVL